MRFERRCSASAPRPAGKRPESSSRTTQETWKRSGLDRADEDASVHFLEALFADELQGHPLLKNKAIWRNFPTVPYRGPAPHCGFFN